MNIVKQTDSGQTDSGSPILSRLRRGLPCLALGLRTARNPDLVRIAAAAGYHKIWVDLEHSTMALDLAAQFCALARDLGMEAWVRIPDGDFGAIGRILDGGASGIIVPGIETAGDARHAASLCRYPPAGTRSQNAFNAGTGYRRQPNDARIARANGSTVVQVLLETPQAVANAAEIAAVPGVDVVSLGLNDLSSACGIAGQVQSQIIMDYCRAACVAARGAGKLVVIGGIAGPDHFRALSAMGAAPYLFAGIDTEMMLAICEQRIAAWNDIAQPTESTLP
ncbi:MAG: aldolase/citrate lyase family protein [Paracoccus sp. (in: a-proteobacteria)]|nr:aldolase/citrate lyase family protein [Paracoccus sp. (in: a-proteobacteria)]